jgi:hypothetical protein
MRACRFPASSIDVVSGSGRGGGISNTTPSPAAEHKGDDTMRVMVLVKASEASEAGAMPSKDILARMGAYNEELVKAGVMLAMEGLHPTRKALRMRFSGDERVIIDGPFAESKELLAGFWLWQVKSLDEAVEWLKRAPFDGGTEIELRPIFELEDFGEAIPTELREQEERLRATLETKG